MSLEEKRGRHAKIEKIYIANDDISHDWTLGEVRRFKYYWARGLAIEYIAKTLKREIDEVALLVIDQSRKGEITRRNSGCFGTKAYSTEKISRLKAY